MRERLLVKCYHLFTDSWSQAERDCCELNKQLVKLVSGSYFQDLERKKAFHEIKLADAHKRAAYMVKWIVRLRPIQLKGTTDSVRVLLANEHFALTFALRFLDLAPLKIPPPLYLSMLYALRFRSVDANGWALSFFLLQRAYEK